MKTASAFYCVLRGKELEDAHSFQMSPQTTQRYVAGNMLPAGYGLGGPALQIGILLAGIPKLDRNINFPDSGFRKLPQFMQANARKATGNRFLSIRT